jgi:fatty acid desaturase
MAVVLRPALEWPTLAVAAAIYAGYGLLTLYYHSLPWWLVLPAAGFLLAWHGSLQHEVVHGHPTRWRWLNRALVFPSLWLWMPLEVYADTHLRHHHDELITDPLADPESYYLSKRDWARAGPVRRAVLRFHNTSVGRLLIGPAVSVWRLMAIEIRAFARGDLRHLKPWLLHLAGCVPVIVWVSVVADIPLLAYLLLFVYPGISITLLRSFAEHRARPALGERIAIVESGPVMSLLYLNNNLHYMHHEAPEAAWYRLPGRWRARRSEVLAANGGYRYSGYGEIIRRFAMTAREPVAWPIEKSA